MKGYRSAIAQGYNGIRGPKTSLAQFIPPFLGTPIEEEKEQEEKPMEETPPTAEE